MQITEEDRRIAAGIEAAHPLQGDGEKAQDHLAAPRGQQGPVQRPFEGLAEWLRVEAEATQLFDLPEEADMLRRWACEVEAADADAERYRWLRNPTLPVVILINGEMPFAVDTAIDAARGAA